MALGTAVTDTVLSIFGGLAEYPVLAKHAYLHASYRMHQLHDEEKGEAMKPAENSLPLQDIMPNHDAARQDSANDISDITGDTSDSNISCNTPPVRPSFFDSNAEYPTGAVHLSNAPFSAVFLDRTVGTGRGMGAVLGAIINFPLLLFLGVSKGFHRVPLLFGDPTVRELPRVTGFHSGVLAAGTVLGYGFLDAVIGLGQLPYIGSQEAGARGALTGGGQAMVGLVIKPLEGIFGVPGYTLEGVHKEVLRFIGKNVRDYVKEVRIVQAEKEVREWRGGDADKEFVIKAWEKLKRTKNVPRKYRS